MISLATRPPVLGILAVAALLGLPLESQDDAPIAAPQVADLSGRDLSHSAFRGADLRGARFRGATLTMADFCRSDLRGADFTGSKADRVVLDDADLRGAIGLGTVNFGFGLSAQRANFAGTDLRGALLVNGYSGAYFEGADFSDADLTGATLSGRFHGAKFEGTIVKDALMIGAAGIDALRMALSERGAISRPEDLASAVRNGRDFTRADIGSVDLSGADLRGARFAGANLHSVRFSNARLDGADLRGAKLYWAELAGASLRDVVLVDAELGNIQAAAADFTGAHLDRANLQGAILRNTTLVDAKLTGAALDGADLTGANVSGAEIEGITVDGAWLNGVRGLTPQKHAMLLRRAARWRHDLGDAFDSFVRDWSPTLAPIVCMLGAILAACGLAFPRARASFGVLLALNFLAALPSAAPFILGLFGGHPTAQMSSWEAWSAWFHLWPVLLLGSAGVSVVALVASAVHVIQHVVRNPRVAPYLSVTCALVTVAGCVLACLALVTVAPDA